MDAHADDESDAPTPSRFTVHDAAGVAWQVEAQWAQVNGRPGAVRLTLSTTGQAAITSTLMRLVEQELRRHAPTNVQTIVDKWLAQPFGLSGAQPEPGEVVDVVTLPDPGEESPRRMGRPRDDAAWRHRRDVVLRAWRERQPLLAALEADEPGLSTHTYRSRLRTLYRWDAEHEGLLRDVGRGLREGRGGGL